MMLITSRQNPKIKQVRALTSRKQRQAQRLYVVEGIRHVGEAVESAAGIDYLIHAPDLLHSDFAHSLVTQLELKNVPVFATTADIFADLAGKDNPQGILAVVRQRLTGLSTLNASNFGWGVAIEAPQDPGNLGTILRTLEAAGADGLIILGGGTDVFHPTAVRASMGSLFWKPVIEASLAEFKAWQNVHQYHLVGSSAKGSVDYREVDHSRPTILLLGSERDGMSNELQEICETIVHLPMHGRATSLNLSVAAGILIYHMAGKF